MKKAVIFDMDGTILDTLDDLNDSMNRILTDYGLPGITRDQSRSFVGNGIAIFSRRAVAGAIEGQRLESFVRDMNVYYAAHCELKTRPYDGMPELLEELKKLGVARAVVTNKAQKAAETVAARYFGDVFDLVVGDSGAFPLKPAPDPLYYAMEKLGVTPADCLYCGDSDVDIATGLAAGVDTVAVEWGFRDRIQLEKAGATMFAKTPADLLVYVQSPR